LSEERRRAFDGYPLLGLKCGNEKDFVDDSEVVCQE
jgi:hypothetical protein